MWRGVVTPTLHCLCFAGESRSEGGFAPNKVSVASLLDVQQAKDKKGKSCVPNTMPELAKLPTFLKCLTAPVHRRSLGMCSTIMPSLH